MLRSKSRSRPIDCGGKRSSRHRNNLSSVLSRTISVSRFCSGDPLISQVDRNALKPVERSPSNRWDSSEIGDFGDWKIKHQVIKQQEKDEGSNGSIQQARQEIKRAANLRTDDASMYSELESVKESLLESRRELKMKDEDIRFLKLRLAEKESSLGKLREELADLNATQGNTKDSLLRSDNRVQELEAEIENKRLSESRLLDSLASQTRQLEETKKELEAYKVEMGSLRQKVDRFKILAASDDNGGCQDAEELKSELRLAKEDLDRAREGESVASLKVGGLVGQIVVLRNELKLATQAEEKSKKAMDDLALALKEVATEGSEAKERLGCALIELKQAKEEAQKLKEVLRSNEERYQKCLEEAWKEAELHRNTAGRLRLEAEESHMAWNGKEMGFVGCIKRADEEKAHVIQENTKLRESQRVAEDKNRAAREEASKLRDILKQALNEASVAKEAAGIAREENSQLKDCLGQRDEALYALTQRNENLTITEAAAREGAKEMQRLVAAVTEELKNVEGKKGQGCMLIRSPNSRLGRHSKEGGMTKKGISFDLHYLKFQDEHRLDKDEKEEVPKNADEVLRGSIFDTAVGSPKWEPHTPTLDAHHRRAPSPATSNGGETPNQEDFDHGDANVSGESDGERNLHRRKRALLRRFSDIIAISSGFRKSHEPHTTD